MQNAFKPFGEKGTASLSGRFLQTRNSLTLVYMIILVMILLLSASFTRTIFSQRLEHRFPRAYRLMEVGVLPAPSLSPDDLRADLLESVLLVNGALLLIAGIFSYWFAGLTLQPIQEAYDRQRRFLSDASHELRTPLAILQTNLENEKAVSQGESRVKIESHLEEVERMKHLVEDLLALSRTSEHVPESLHLTRVDLNTVVQEMIGRLQSVAVRSKVKLRFVLDARVSIEVRTDKDLFERVLDNVVRNAIHYNKEDGSVDVSISADANHSYLEVRDTGIGIPQQDLVYIFDRFYRVDKSRSRQTGGNGLGLAIVKATMDRLGGTVSIESELEKGTTVTLSLPIHSAS